MKKIEKKTLASTLAFHKNNELSINSKFSKGFLFSCKILKVHYKKLV